MGVKAEDEFLHLPSSNDPRWREGYHFNGYDAVSGVGLSISVGIRPALGLREEIVMVHLPDPLIFLNLRNLEGEDALKLGSLKMEPVTPLEQWKIQMEDSFWETEQGMLSSTDRQVVFGLRFESSIPPYGYSTDRGERYEQPGVLKGTIGIGEKTVGFEGRGIRDHSWELREMSNWDEWYSLMGWFESGEALSFTRVQSGDKMLYDGWWRADLYHEIRNVQIDPVFSGDVLKECRMYVETPKEGLQVTSQLISLAAIPLGAQSQGKLMETLVALRLGESRGCGFLWYRG